MKWKRKVLPLCLALAMVFSCIQVPAAAASNVSAEWEPIESAFTDAAFLTAVREIVGKTNGEPVYQSDVEGITKLELISLHIANLDGIEYFTGLRELYCYDNDILTLDLSQNHNLEVLDCSYNTYLEFLDILNCPELRLLDCNYTALEGLNLSRNTKLTRLVCYSTFLGTLNISSNVLLEELDVCDAHLVNLDVSNNSKLVYLDCSYNDMCSVENVKGLENCTALQDDNFTFEPQNNVVSGHSWDTGTVTIEPSCTEKGETTYTCSKCGLTKSGDIPPYGHAWDAWTITAKPSLTVTGTARRVCRNDSSHTESVSLPVLSDTKVWTKGDVVDGQQEYTSLYGTVAIAIPSPPPIDPGTPDKPDTPKMVFIDVRENDWFYDSVNYIYEQGLMVGTDKDRFSPNLNASRAMIVSVLWRLEGSPAPTKEALYTDCDSNAYYAQAVAWGTEKGVLVGYGEGLFGPVDSITREQLAAALYRYAGTPETGGNLSAFRDGEQTSDFAETALCWAVESGVICGKGNRILDPKGNATRAEAAAMIRRFMAVPAD